MASNNDLVSIGQHRTLEPGCAFSGEAQPDTRAEELFRNSDMTCTGEHPLSLFQVQDVDGHRLP
jgi:hypothetical protein